MAKNVIGTLYDDNGVAVATTATGRTSAGVSASPQFTALVVAGQADPANALAANAVIPVAAQIYNGATFDLPQGSGGVAFTSAGGKTTAVVASGTNSDTVIKASAGRLARISVTSAAGTTTGTTPIYDNASGHTGTILVVVPNNTAIGTMIDVNMPAALGITVNGGANSPGMTISFI